MTSLYNQKGEVIKKINLPKEIFGQKPNPVLLAQAARVYLDRQKVKTASTKTRAEVAGGGRKPHRQKGTGSARAGSIRSPLWRGGGIVFGPKPGGTPLVLPKKMRAKALATAISVKLTEKSLTIVDKLEFKGPKTKKAVEFLGKSALKDKKKVLLVLPDKDETVVKSFRNLQKVGITRALDLNTLDVLKFPGLIFTLEAVDKFKERWKSGNKQSN
ncbi:MAG: 50S ribosomal protein L4 [Candidatus Woykebacteria bacterium RBG_16_44_10]|uniref:Large ribosomal subunit protein uL4 n=1 Tax=Candidatus Woykebacteria bacterium RBG_16_44_10 TaxID=1802597 RepID=A0A1G1WEZ7_9BACT|nr:MAG: 50S ribosomal protein L4 [Candidatus Woykebacteria bacterium RBG_16_44_10]